MKKNISINISGIIFHIEEDGYESLRKYLDSINRYFSTFEDSSEILPDIESRIAEIFLSKLNEGKQVITAEDVNSLIATMGSVSDFKAVEEQEPSTAQAPPTSSTQENKSEQKTFSAPKKLYRDQNRKILGGVCSGIGSYLNVDPVWIRLLFIIVTFAFGITLFAYVIMWIVVPGSYDVEEPQVKKMFRDPEHKVIAGVSGGLASFFGIDIVAVRVLFIAFTIAGGFGIIIYIVLWAILPEAKSLTDKMQMQGERVTLSNIESNIKKNQSLTGSDEETPFQKILLFPFRLIGIIITALARVLVPIIEILRVAMGIIITLLGVAFVFAVVVICGIMIGIFTRDAFGWGSDLHFPAEIFTNTFPPLTILAAFIVAVIPGTFMILLGISTAAKRVVFGSAIGWTLFVFFFAGVAVLGVSIPGIAYAFDEDGEYKIETNYEPTGKRVVLKVNETGLDDYNVTRLTLKGYDGKKLRLVQSYVSQGSSVQNAIENAKMIEYTVDFKDSVLTFDRNIQFKDGAKFRAQRMNLTLYIPFDMPFTLDRGLSRVLTNYFKKEDLNDQNTWKMTANGHTCVACSVETSEGELPDLTDFSEIEVRGVINVDIRQGDHYVIDITGDDDERIHNIHKDGKKLIIDFPDDVNFNIWKKHTGLEDLKINITMPTLEKIEAKGAGKVSFHEFSNEKMEIEALGAVKIHGELHVQNLNITISGASSVDLQGEAKNMEANIIGASSLDAYQLEVIDAIVEVKGVSNAKVNVSGTLEMDANMTSDIDYHGNPTITKHN